MCRDFTVRFERAGLATPRFAREFVSTSLDSELSGPALAASVDAAVLVVSELVTNAVRAGAAAVQVGLDVHRSHLRLCVDDDAAGWPHQQRADLDDTHGRGLAIVAALADGWSAEATDAGKRVWADIPFAEGLAHSFPCDL